MALAEWFQQDEEFFAVPNSSGSLWSEHGHKKCEDSLPGVGDPCKCKKGSGNARLVFCIQSCVSTDPCSLFWQRILKYYEQPIGCPRISRCLRSSGPCLRRGQDGKTCGPSLGVRLISSSPSAFSTHQESKQHLLSTEGMPQCVTWTSIQGSRCLKVVMERGAHAFKVHEKEELRGVSNAELEELLATARAPAGTSLCSGARAVVVALLFFFCLDRFLLLRWH